MAGEKDLGNLLKNMSPVLNNEVYTFISIDGSYGDFMHLKPLCSFQEAEGLTLIITEETAKFNSIKYDEKYKFITLEVHSSLDAVGLTAAVSAKLAEAGISANVVAAYYHDHIFVQAKFADRAVELLLELTKMQIDAPGVSVEK